MPLKTMTYHCSSVMSGSKEARYRNAIANGRTSSANRKTVSGSARGTSPPLQERRQGAGRVPPVGDRVLLLREHLRERPVLPVRLEDRVEAEPRGPPRLRRDRAPALAPERVRLPAETEADHGLEPRLAAVRALEEAEDARDPDRAERVRGVDAREALQRVHEEAGVVDHEVEVRLSREHLHGVCDDLVERVPLDLREEQVVVLDLDALRAEEGGDLAELARVRRHEPDHVYRPRSSISASFAIAASAPACASRYAARTSDSNSAWRSKWALVHASFRSRRSTPWDSTESVFSPIERSIGWIRPSRQSMFEVVRSPWTMPCAWSVPARWPTARATGAGSSRRFCRTSFTCGPSTYSMTSRWRA